VVSFVTRILFAILVVATFAAFFVAQRIKNAPKIVQIARYASIISPNGDGYFDTRPIAVKLTTADRMTLEVVDDDGDPVRVLLRDRAARAYTAVRTVWDGRDDDGRLVPDGRYKLRVALRDEGRAVILPRAIVKDTKPPSPAVAYTEPSAGPHPELLPLPNGAPVVSHFRRAGADPRAIVFQTAPAVREVMSVRLNERSTSWSWDGTVGGRRVAPGTYVVALRWRDSAMNLGTSIPLDSRGLPTPARSYDGNGGVTVRYLGVSPPETPVKARERAIFAVDARGGAYRWAIRRVGADRPVKRGRATRTPISVTAPAGPSGIYLFEARRGAHATRVPFAVQARSSAAGTASAPRGVLVVAPAITWQGRNPVDDEGDGAPNLLDRGSSVELRRVYSDDGLPVGFASQESPLLRWLDRHEHHYDLTTDVALARSSAGLSRYRGVLLAGDARWQPPALRTALRSFVRRGGTVVSTGTDSLLRTVELSDGRLVDPSRRRTTDLFGARLSPLQSAPTDLENFGSDEIGLFAETGGQVADVTRWEQTLAVGREADQVAAGVTADTNPPGKTVIVAARFGQGLIIRSGFKDFSSRLSTDFTTSALMGAMWTQLAR
jgi:hypothetical protein